MMVFGGWLACGILAALQPWPVQADAQGFALPLAVESESLAHAATVRRTADVVVWLPAARAVRQDVAVAAGPVARVVVRPRRHGVAVVLTPRAGLELAPHVELRATPRPVLRVAPPPPSPAVLLPAAAPLAGPPLPAAAHDALTSWPAEHAPPWRQAAWPSVAVACSMVLGVGLWLQRRRPSPAAHGRIDVLAQRCLGSKHTLALIETCGERLLVATSDREVTLLSHLPIDAALGVDAAASAGPEALGAADPDAQDAVSAAAPPGGRAAVAPAAFDPAAIASADVQGLLRLRRGPRRFAVVR